ncbi:unnamed protein product [Cuscuta europaea]|nr:unnamed protein product [Cuscuta europaea]
MPGIAGLSIQHWKYWPKIHKIRKKLRINTWTISLTHPKVNGEAVFFAYHSMSIKTNSHHFNQFVGILKFDVVSFPYVL